VMDLQNNHQENPPETGHLTQNRTLYMSDKCYMNQHLLPAVVESHPSPLLYQLLMIHKLYSQKDQLEPDNHSNNCGETENTNNNKDKIPQMDTIQPLDLSIRNKTDLNITSKPGDEQGLRSSKQLLQRDSEKSAGLHLLSTCSEMMDYRRTDRTISSEETISVKTKDAKAGHDVITEFISGKIKQYGKKKRKRHLTKCWEISEKEVKIQSKMSKLQNKYARIKHKLNRLEKTKEASLITETKEASQENALTNENAFMTEADRDHIPGMNPVQYHHNFIHSTKGEISEHKQPVIKEKNRLDDKRLNDVGCSVPDACTLTDNDLVNGVPDPCTLTENDLVEGVPVLLRRDGVYHPGSLRCIMPPDIYGVLVTRDRGNKPVILPREELIKDVIHDLRPKTVAQLEVGTRVCAFWSSKIPFLHPGTVTGPDSEEDFVIIELDDGDCRDIHIDQVRYLSGNSYPQQTEGPAKIEIKSQDCKITSDKEYKRMGEQETPCQITQPKIPWTWADSGQKLSPKARNVYHQTIQRNSETISVGDCAVFTSVGESSHPYIGRIDSMWQTTAWGMKVRVQWFYHKTELIRQSGEEDMETKDDLALFSSNHFDENNVQTISHKCQVLGPGEIGDGYYIAGEYDPTHKIVIQSH